MKYNKLRIQHFSDLKSYSGVLAKFLIILTVSRRLPTSASLFRARSGHVGFVVDKVALGQVFSEYFSFPCHISFHRLFHAHHLSAGDGTIGQLLILTPPKKKPLAVTSKHLTNNADLASMNTEDYANINHSYSSAFQTVLNMTSKSS
jgi:hypothetical protein